MQNVPIIISEKVLKRIFFEVIDEINNLYTHKYEIIDQYTKKIQSSSQNFEYIRNKVRIRIIIIHNSSNQI